jgi:flagellar protein FliO/FliZ
MNYSPDLISASLKMLAALGIMLGGLLIVLHYAKRKLRNERGGFKGKTVRVLGNTYIGPKKRISLVEVPGAILVVGITNENISLLNKIEDEEMLEEFKRSQGRSTSPSFSEYFQKFSLRLKERKSNG